MMRIVGGTHRHRMIKWPVNPDTRPTKDMVRQGIFNALGANVKGKEVLDLFAGSGAMGLEALSRGAKSVTFVDRGHEAIECVKSNLSELKFENSEVLCSEAFAAVGQLSERKKSFDIIILDPPYIDQICENMIKIVSEKGVWAKDGIMVCETRDPIHIDEALFHEVRKYHYGITSVTIIWR